VTALRRHLLHRPVLVACLLALALLAKLVVPSGFMLGTSGDGLTIEICTGYGPMKMVMPGTGGQHDKQDGVKEMPCAFSGLSAPSLAAADPILLALAIAFVIALGYRAETPRPVRAAGFLRPPLRGPPARI